MKSKKIILVSILLPLLSSCSWESQLYKKYVNDEGRVTQCQGYCQQTYGREACQDKGIWIPAKCVIGGVENLNIDKSVCQEQAGVWSDGACLITDAVNCTGDAKWIPLEFTTLDLGNGYYVWKDGEQIKCGIYDEIGSETIGECKNDEYIAQLNEVLKYQLCPTFANRACTEVRDPRQKTVESGDDDGTEDNAGGDGDKTGISAGMCSSCPVGQYRCMANGSSECFDLLSNREHCGACGNRCSVGEICDNGKCAVIQACVSPDLSCGFEVDGLTPKCYDAEKYCGSTCVDGHPSGGIECMPNAKCVSQNNDDGESEFTCVCLEGYFPEMDGGNPQTDEDDKIISCIDPLTDPHYCGSKEAEIKNGIKHYCLDNEHCENGVCVCNTHHIRCNGACINPEANNLYCGASGTCSEEDEASENYIGQRCSPGTVCRDKICVCDAENGYLSCNTAEGKLCVHPADAHYCGANDKNSNNTCGTINYQDCTSSLEICVFDDKQNRYQCQCQEGEVKCNGKCIDPKIHPTYCGAKDGCMDAVECSATEVCRDGKCQSSCPDGQVPCNHQCVSIENDLNHCGACNFACSFDNGYGLCINGVCHFAACMAGYGNCDGGIVSYQVPEVENIEPEDETDDGETGSDDGETGSDDGETGSDDGETGSDDGATGSDDAEDAENPENLWSSIERGNGCEINLTNDLKNCGSCGNICEFDHANTSCEGGKCQIKSCSQGYLDCDGKIPNGCELNVTNNVNHCGACNNKCSFKNASAKCESSKCEIKSCNSGYGNCDSKADTGCEINVTNNVNHCGKCNNKCSLSCFSSDSCTNKCASSKCCVTGDVNKKYSKSEVQCCSGYTRYKYTKKDKCKKDTHFGCYKNKPSGECWTKDS